MISEIKKLLETEIKKRKDEGIVTSVEEETKAAINELNDLLNEATLSLARILAKQGYVSAKSDNHHQALVRR